MLGTGLAPVARGPALLDVHPPVACLPAKCYLRLQLRRELIPMPDLTISREILIDAPVDVVWRTITEPDQMSQWFADRVDLVIEPGAHGYMQFGDQGGPVGVEAVDPPTRLHFPRRPR